ncbi:MAG: hypothetical protein ABJN69_09975 [Hellea sp.]
MSDSKKDKAKELAIKTIEDAEYGLRLNTDEGRKLAYNALILTLQTFEGTENKDHNSRIFMLLGDVYTQIGDVDTALKAYGNAVNSPNGLGDPDIHLRIGKSFFEKNDETQSLDNLSRALIMGGKKIFEGEDAKYFKFVTTALDPPPEGWDAYEPPAA